MLPFEQAEEDLTGRYKREQSVLQILKIKDWRLEGRTIPEIKAILNKSDSDSA
ncbi:MAG: hypothetical protein NC543_14130 [bacterium]|nr:hypothetical protein [bacterium]